MTQIGKQSNEEDWSRRRVQLPSSMLLWAGEAIELPSSVMSWGGGTGPPPSHDRVIVTKTKHPSIHCEGHQAYLDKQSFWIQL
jgi:hypothetical protein